MVGGGNSALEEAVSLTKYASKVTIVHQFDHFQAFEHAIEEARNNPKIDFIMESTITAFYGNENLESVDIKNLKTGVVIISKPMVLLFLLVMYQILNFLRKKLILTNGAK